jgi:taurine dioxygenase
MNCRTFDLKKIFMGYKLRDIENRAHTFPRSIHPLVYNQAGAGRKMLNLSPWFADAIVGMENEEGHAILRELCEHVLRGGKVYAHRWRKGDLVL